MEKKIDIDAMQDFIRGLNRLMYQKHGASLNLRVLHGVACSIMDDKVEREIVPFIEELSIENLSTLINTCEKYIEKEADKDIIYPTPIENDDIQ